ncbi:charged multivesicular body protein 6-B [Copidosoma floridanum]|uniref:charged multivesicular body protein 6-B n=1 Tax=Copidosoma floridanum TaxID=29053 RepID=UPI0006C98AE6|nr:charged multivesicular body protein 6-B [Copidosoma floridanum]
MGMLFSKKKPPSRVTDQDKAVLQLKQSRDKIKQYQKRVEQKIEKEREIAKKLIKNNQKDRALLLLRKKKFQEQILVRTDGQLESLERMVTDIEFAQVEIKVIDGLKIGNDALKKLHALISIEDIEQVLEDTQEGIEKQREINELLSGGLSVQDEDEIEAELDALVAQDSVKEKVTSDVPEDILLPNVPENEPNKEKAIKSKVQEPVALEA